MAANVRSPVQRMHDRALIVQMTNAGIPQAVIAERLGVTQGQVSQDYQKIKADIESKGVSDAAIVYREIEEMLSLMIVECLGAFERSKADKTVEIAKRKTKGGGDGSDEETSLRREARVGDPRYWDLIHRALELRGKLAGLYKDKGDMVINFTLASYQQITQQLKDGTPVLDVAAMHDKVFGTLPPEEPGDAG